MADLARNLDERYTYGDYRTWDDDERWELIDGRAWCMSPAPMRRHQKLILRLGRKIGDFLEGRTCEAYIAPFDVLLPEGDEDDEDVQTVVQSDLVVYCDRSRLRDFGARGAPTFVIEILSPSTAKKDLGDKFALYERHGVREYWVVDPDAHVVHAWDSDNSGRVGRERLHKLGESVKSTSLDGLVVDTGELFAEA